MSSYGDDGTRDRGGSEPSGGASARDTAAPLIRPSSGLSGSRGLHRRDVLRYGLAGIGGAVLGALGGFAIGRSQVSASGPAHPITAPSSDAPVSGANFPITVSDTRRGFVDADGRPFFYLADTAWNAISRMTREAFETLATARRDAGFTALQLSLLDFLPASKNAYGRAPFTSTGKLASPKIAADGDDYWGHVAWCIDTCRALGLVACLVPSWYGGWGDAWRGYLTPDNARLYGAFLATRFGDRDNVWWLLGGDNAPDVTGDSTSGVPAGLDRGPRIVETNAMGRALQQRSSSTQLMSYHTARGLAVEDHFGQEEWYQISAAYSGADPVPLVAAEYERDIVRPVVLWEAYYAARQTEPILDRRAVRAQAYHAVFSGASGFAYGHEDVWPVKDEWFQALKDDTAADIGTLSALLATYAATDLAPVSAEAGTLGMLPDGYGTPETTSAVSAATLAEGRGALAYFGEPRGAVRVDTTALDATAEYEIRWASPSTQEELFVAGARSGDDITIGWPSSWTDAVLILRR